MILVMVDLGVIFGARIYTAIYALYRVAGKYVYASITQSPNTIKNYLGLTLLSRYGVSLVFTGLPLLCRVNVQIIRGIIVIVAVINEVNYGYRVREEH